MSDREPIILIGRAHDPTDDKLDHLLDGCTIELAKFSTEELLAMAARRREIDPTCWMAQMIEGYLEVWR